ncbi:MAG TPA: hypothetical protein DCR28_00075 [Eubacterium sp.]|nr:hypothetical protein [Eubacterium sp.]
MKKKLLSIVLSLTLVIGCCATFAPATVQAKKFKASKVKIVKFSPEYLMLPEDDIACKKVYLFINKNKQVARVDVTVRYFKGKEEVHTDKFACEISKIAYIGIGNIEESYDTYKVDISKVRKAKGVKQIKKKKVKITYKKTDVKGRKKVTIKNKSKSNGVFQIVNVFYNKKGKVVDMQCTHLLDIKKKKKKSDYLFFKAVTGLGSKIKYKKMKTFYNFIKY